MQPQVSSVEQDQWEALIPPAIVSPEPRVALVSPLDFGDQTPELGFGARIDENGRRRGSGESVAPALIGGAGWSALADPVSELMAKEEECPEDPQDLAERLLRKLPLLERQVVRFRFGIGGTPPLSQLEIATRLGIARRTVQSLEYRALDHLREFAAGDGGPELIRAKGTALPDDADATYAAVAA